MTPTLDTPLSDLPEVKAADERRLTHLGLITVRDLLFYLPFDWENYQPSKVNDLQPGEQARVEGTISKIVAKRTPRRNMQLTEAVLIDDDDAGLKLVWFNMPFVAKQINRGDRVAVAGKVQGPSRFSNQLEMRNPRHERLRSGDEGPRGLHDLMPKYHLTKGLTSMRVAFLVAKVIDLADQLEDPIPDEVRARHDLLPIGEAIRLGHRPENEQEWRRARQRMAFAELLELQIAFLLRRREMAAEEATRIPYHQEVIERFKEGVGFELTQAQRRAIWDVYKDMDGEVPMNRLLNGEVGSGKTAVAAAAVAMAHAAGVQSVVMAPTEILARQHLAKFRTYLEDTFPDLRVELLISGQAAAERRRVRTAAASGHCALLVGTHALIEDEVELSDLGLAVVDEQHRFGTEQRERLRNKAGRGRPHFLAMTATPIPRSMALAMYGEMALSVIDELPPGRTPVETSVVAPSRREEAYELVRREVAAGRQAFIICPLIEESETVEARAATAEFERLRQEVFPDLRLALVHGKVRDKDGIMGAFRNGEADILVATAVIEVGVDVPNAAVMLIEGADRFGLAQLHQFRGRVGRGSHASHCLLLVDDPSEKSLSRLQLLSSVNDGFRLAEEDMRLRGAGELLGARQHGMSDIAMQGLFQPQLLSEIQEEAERLLEGDPDLEGTALLRDAARRRLERTAIS
ncbi:MAG TPA: ATP-dependent DNA helicase RecG [Candidatus Dormibacteraeota bacterium]|jgi:ATP-dependent DNA helicase RecG|nr:ATP-dependent DNA helicase RecG [Candidatus Dormibacteraeota bacterium]